MKNVNKEIEQLIQYLDGKLDAQEGQKVQEAIAGNPELAELYDVIRKLREQGETFKTMSLGVAAKKLSKQIFKDFKKSQKDLKAKYGITIFDSKVLPIPQGVRPATVDTRRLKYRFDNWEIEISLYPITPESYEIIGQISGMKAKGSISLELKSRDTTFISTTDRFYLFRFARVPAEKYKLLVIDDSQLAGTIDLEI